MDSRTTLGVPSRVLIIKLSALGDIVHTLPVLHCLKETWPECQVDWITGEVGKGLLEKHPLIDKVIVYPRRQLGHLAKNPVDWPKLWKELKSLRKKLKTGSYDIALDLQGLFKSGLITALSGAKIKAGFDKTREYSHLFLNYKAPAYDPDRHAVLRYLDLAQFIGASCNEVKFPILVEKQHLEKAQNLVDWCGIGNKRFVILIPGTIWQTKRWTTSSFAELALLMQRKLGLESVIIGGSQDKELGTEIHHLSMGVARDLTGHTDLKTLSALFKMACLGVSTDTGPMHLAAACGLRLVALFGPTAPWRTGPYGKDHVVIRKEMDCSPCFKRICHHNSCMKSIEALEVFETVKTLLHC